MSLIERKIESLPFVLGELNYLAPTDGKPRTYAFDPPAGEPKSTALPEPHQVPVFDGRSVSTVSRLIAKALHWSGIRRRCGTSTTIKRYGSVYYPAAEAFIRATLARRPRRDL